MDKIKGFSVLTGESVCLQNIADQKKRAEELAESASAESQRPTKASGMAAPVVPEPVKAGDKRRNRWDQSNSLECAPNYAKSHFSSDPHIDLRLLLLYLRS